MTKAKSDLIEGIFSQLKLSAWWTVLAAAQFGLELAKVLWKLHDEFYPFNLLLWEPCSFSRFWRAVGHSCG